MTLANTTEPRFATDIITFCHPGFWGSTPLYAHEHVRNGAPAAQWEREKPDGRRFPSRRRSA
ncbi:hypothetical protein AB0J35_36225 [Nonomuraea angiospora]|uniref:hypothetical protein n=1 Tax=Nonomuraea angiospora TaxID=46172 RepID=UPI003441181A